MLEPVGLSGLTLDTTVEVGDLLTVVAVLLSVCIALIGAARELGRFRRTIAQGNEAMRSAHYSELDRTYGELLKIALDYPFLRAPQPFDSHATDMIADYEAFPAGSAERERYDTYAFMLWNFLETIHDRCEGNSADKQTLRETWGPVLTAENSVHRGWFLMEMRREAHAAHQAQREGKHYEPSYKFCEAFRVFVLERRWNDAAHENHDDRCWAYRRTFRNPPKFGLA